MCLMTVKEEEYTPAARYKRVSRTSRRYSNSPPRAAIERSSYYRRTEAAPPPPPQPVPPTSIAPPPASTTIPPPPQSVRSKRTSRAPSTTRSHYVQVESETSSSSSSSSEDVRSRATSHKPRTEYSFHEREKEIRRERGYSRPRAPEYETYRYVNAPREERSRGPRDSGGVEREIRIRIEDERGDRRRTGEYRR